MGKDALFLFSGRRGLGPACVDYVVFCVLRKALCGQVLPFGTSVGEKNVPWAHLRIGCGFVPPGYLKWVLPLPQDTWIYCLPVRLLCRDAMHAESIQLRVFSRLRLFCGINHGERQFDRQARLPDWARNRKLGGFFRPVALFFLELLFPPIGLFLAILKKMKKKIKKKLRKIKDFLKKNSEILEVSENILKNI